MGQWQYHTPVGVADLLPRECAAKRQVEQRLRDVFCRRGYQEIETPGIEFYDVYAAGSDTVPQEGLFKFFDEQGRILCLRYDGTVPAARVAATLCRDNPVPLRLAYIGNMYRYNEYGGGKQREFGQAGIELMGSDAPEADAEVIATAIEAALAVGIEDLQVSVGQVGFFHGLLAEWQIDGADAALLPQLIDSKQQVALDELAERLGLPDRARSVMRLMSQGLGSETELNELATLVRHPLALAALENLRAVLSILDDVQVRPYISVDLGMLQSLNYYTGVIFKGFTYGLGFPLFSGGRYDGLVRSFGRDLAATGFSMGTSLTLAALQRQGKTIGAWSRPVRLGYLPGQHKKALRTADSLRRDGLAVSCDPVESAAAWLAHNPDGPVLLVDARGEPVWLREVTTDA